MTVDMVITPARLEAEAARGHWPGRLLTEYLDEAAAALPDKAAIIDVNSMTGDTTTLTYGELARIVDRMALGLYGLGIRRGDVVSLQLPNWWQFSALHMACVRIGAATNALMPIFRQRELGFMLGLAESRLLVVPRRFRKIDYPEMIAELRPGLPALEHVLVIGGEGADSFEAALIDRRWEDELDPGDVFGAERPDANELTQLLFTSGTTGEPKGVMHTSNTLIGSVIECIGRYDLSADDVLFMASPVGHQIGFMYGVMMSVMLRSTLVLQDIWSPGPAAETIERHGVTFTMASTAFLADLTDCPDIERCDIGSLRIFLSSGAPIPHALVRRARKRLDAAIISAWGMTEFGIMTATLTDDAEEKAFETDGGAVPGAEVRVVGDDGLVVPPGTPGLLQARGSSTFIGYLKRPDLYDVDADGWFNTGDLATMDSDGYIRIVGRAKDIIIRGGENVPVVEIENILYRHPAVRDAAIVGMPDQRLGERICAFVAPRPGEEFSFEAMADFLAEQKMAQQYFPERLELIDDMPRNAAGKIQKFVLRERAAALAQEGLPNRKRRTG